MFRCDNCGSGYSIRAASSWESCPRCLAKDRIDVPLSFELGWRGRDRLEKRPPRGPEMELVDPAALSGRPLG